MSDSYIEDFFKEIDTKFRLEGRPLALDFIYNTIDDWLLKEKFETVRFVLKAASEKIERFPLSVFLSILTITRSRSGKLNPEWNEFEILVNKKKEILKEGSKMPGPVSDSYDPEFGTGENANDVREAIQDVVERINDRLGPDLKYIVQIAQNLQEHSDQPSAKLDFCEDELRVIRFSLLRALESI